MSPTNDFDIGPLSWVKPEIDATLNRARESLEEAAQPPGKREQLRFAQGHMHQASGALSLVGLDGVAQFSEAIDKLLSALVADESQPPAAQFTLAQRAIAVLANYLNELMAGAQHQPLRLYPVYRELVTARGGDDPAQSELFFPDLSVRPSLNQVTPIAPDRAAHELRLLRGRFEKGLLAWIRKPADAAGPTEMLNAVRRIEQISSLPATRSFWWAAIAYFEGLAQHVIAPDRHAHRLCRRIDTQMRRLIEGSQVVAERLVRDVLYFVATAKIQSEHASSVRKTYQLEQLLPAADVALSDTLRQPLLLRVREALEHTKEAWNRFCAGAAVALPLFQQQLQELAERTQPLKMAQIDRLLESMLDLAEWLRADPLRHNEDMAMEVATALLVLEQATESAAYDPQLLLRQVDLLCQIYNARRKGATPPVLDDALFGEASRRAQERLFFNQLAREILTNLGQIEQTLDAFFRNPDTQREALSSLGGPLKQIEGAFSMLGEATAAQLVRSSANQVALFSAASGAPESADCDAIAHNLSALGFYVEALRGGPARLEQFLNPESAKAPEAEVAAASDTVEAQLARETRETHSLAEALKEAPENNFLRDQLVSSLEAIREDAHLLADANLEQQTKEAIANLKSGGEFTPEKLDVALSSVMPAAVPQPSAEAARLMQVSSEELDAELLAIFLEEAHEVLATQAESRDKAAAQHHDVDALTTVRRGFHTLKGSSRMVGLQDFSEAARHVEMAMNRWLQLEKDAEPELLSLIDNGRATFEKWVAQLENGGSLWYDANALIAEAQALLARLDPAPDELEGAMPTTAAPPSAGPISGPGTTEGAGGNVVAPEPTAPESIVQGAELAPIDLPDEILIDEFESSLEETRMESPLLHSLGMEAGATSPATESTAEFDLTSTLLNAEELEAIGAGNSLQEIDLTATLMDGDPFINSGLDFELSAEPEETASEDDIGLEEHAADLVTTSLDFELDSEGKPAAEDEIRDLGAEPLPLPEPVVAETVVAATPAVEIPGAAEPLPVPPSAKADEGLEVVAIDDEDDAAEDNLPHINFNILGNEAPDHGSVAERVAELVATPQAEEATPVEAIEAPALVPDTDIVIGDVSLSRGLYDLYLAEAKQHIETLQHEQSVMEGSPLHVPTVPAIRAAHTLAGISGTARMESVLALARALEHSLHRFEELAMPPDGLQAMVIGEAVAVLDGMVSEIAEQRLPEASPKLADQLDQLWPHQPSSITLPSHHEDASTEPLAETDAAEETEETSQISDDLDEQLLPIFFEEADELTTEIGVMLRQLQADPSDIGGSQGLARIFHTLKGSARMAGAMRLGEFVHGLEARLEHATSHGQMNQPMVEELESGLDHITAMIELLRNPAATVAGVAPAEAVAEEAPTPGPSGATGQIPSILLQAPEPVLVAEEDAPQVARALVRVRADMVDRFVNEAGEISIARTRVEGEMRTLRRSLLDLTENVIRLRNQLREVEIQAESQMQSRIAAAESQHGNFDPLEFDRFTRLQELTRMMAESVGDVTTIQQNLLRNLDSADAALHAQGRLSRDLQQALMSVRMVPFEDIAERLYRVVRQTAKELGKRANLDIRGGRIEIDRGVLDKMVAPIEHLLRNAIAHGIEMPSDRAAAGKPDIGQITLSLNQLSNEIALELADDGRGLNYERILARGRAVGLVGAEETPSENRLTQLIFEPGFSTAETVSGIAGRGVGMDVVKNETLSVGGRIDTTTTPGQGTRFLIHLPLTLAVTQALLVRCADRTYAIPSNMVEQALELKEAALDDIRERGFAAWKDQQYPLRYLPRLLGDVETQPVQGRYYWVLLLRAGNERLGLQIDELRGNQEIIVKNAGPQFVRLQGFTGATVLPDGEISLIVNPVVLAGRITVADEVIAGAAAPAQTEHVPTVMVVDDSLTVRKITSRLLEREGYQVVTAKDGVDALEQLVDIKPDVMLLDIEMPRMDGFDLARNVRADERLRSIPIIMITSRMADKHRNYALEIGVNHYLGKPYQEEQLLELIAGYVGLRR